MSLVKPITNNPIPEKSLSGDNKITPAVIDTATKSVFANRTAVIPRSYPEVYGTLLQYTEGVPTPVEYFKKRGPMIGNQSIDTSFSLERAVVHFSFDLIHDFEIRIIDQLEISVDTTNNETSVIGKAVVYPGFKPNVGDIFYLKLPDNRIGVFLVNMNEPMSILHGNHYRIEFHMDSMLTETTDDKLRQSVVDELYFSKQKYFSDDAALLTSTSYRQLEALVNHRASIINYLTNNLYSNTEKTIIREDKVYDPYLIEYLTNKVSVRDSRKDICHIPNPYISSFNNTIWSTFLQQDISIIKYLSYTLHYYKQYLFDVNTSNIDLYRMVSLIDKDTVFDKIRLTQAKFNETDTEPKSVMYIFSDRFYFALLKSFETGSAITNITPLLTEMASDNRIIDNLQQQFYSVSDNAYHDPEWFDAHTKVTGSNNDVHLPEIEFMIFDYITSNRIDTQYLIEKVLTKFPFVAMTKHDQLYTLCFLIHLIDVSINRIR